MRSAASVRAAGPRETGGGAIAAHLLSTRGSTGCRRPATVRYDPGMATLTRADVEHVAQLARLGLTDAELTELEGSLNHILEQYAILARLDTEAIPPTAQTIELESILREDVAGPSLPVAVALANAPERDGDFVVVPAILGGEG